MSESWRGASLPQHYNRLYAFSDAEIAGYLAPLEFSPEDVFIDFGCGNGAAVAAAFPLVKHVIGVDVSGPQLELARGALAAAAAAASMPASGEIRECDFLQFEPGSERYSKGASRKALHHLTDPQKADFFKRIGPAFPSGALFYIEDGMLDHDRSRLEEQIPAIVADAAPYYGERWPAIREDVLNTFRNEFPTSRKAWMNALRAGGFEPVLVWRRTCFYGGILARKE